MEHWVSSMTDPVTTRVIRFCLKMNVISRNRIHLRSTNIAFVKQVQQCVPNVKTIIPKAGEKMVSMPAIKDKGSHTTSKDIKSTKTLLKPMEMIIELDTVEWLESHQGIVNFNVNTFFE